MHTQYQHLQLNPARNNNLCTGNTNSQKKIDYQNNLEMASETIARLRGKRTKPKRPVRYVTIDCIATRRRHTIIFRPTTTSTRCANLKAPKPPPAIIHHHHHLPRLSWLNQWNHFHHCSILHYQPIRLKFTFSAYFQHMFMIINPNL